MSRVNTPLAGYPAPYGNKYHEICDHKGPSSYPTGGEVINASDFSEGGFESALVEGYSFSGSYFARVQWPRASTGAAFKTFKLIWYVLASGLEVGNAVDLSAEYQRLNLTMV